MKFSFVFEKYRKIDKNCCINFMKCIKWKNIQKVACNEGLKIQTKLQLTQRTNFTPFISPSNETFYGIMHCWCNNWQKIDNPHSFVDYCCSSLFYTTSYFLFFQFSLLLHFRLHFCVCRVCISHCKWIRFVFPMFYIWQQNCVLFVHKFKQAREQDFFLCLSMIVVVSTLSNDDSCSSVTSNALFIDSPCAR